MKWLTDKVRIFPGCSQGRKPLQHTKNMILTYSEPKFRLRAKIIITTSIVFNKMIPPRYIFQENCFTKSSKLAVNNCSWKRHFKEHFVTLLKKIVPSTLTCQKIFITSYNINHFQVSLSARDIQPVPRERCVLNLGFEWRYSNIFSKLKGWDLQSK